LVIFAEGARRESRSEVFITRGHGFIFLSALEALRKVSYAF